MLSVDLQKIGFLCLLFVLLLFCSVGEIKAQLKNKECSKICFLLLFGLIDLLANSKMQGIVKNGCDTVCRYTYYI